MSQFHGHLGAYSGLIRSGAPLSPVSPHHVPHVVSPHHHGNVVNSLHGLANSNT